METEDLDKIWSKNFSDLTAVEKNEIHEICSSEENFLQMQQFFNAVENFAQDTSAEMPSKQVKENLDQLFHETYQSKGILWYNTLWATLYPTSKRFDQRPLVRVAAILLLFISVFPFLNRPRTNQQNLLAKQEMPMQKGKEIKENSADNAQKSPKVEDLSQKGKITIEASTVQPTTFNLDRSDAIAQPFEESENISSLSTRNDNLFEISAPAVAFSKKTNQAAEVSTKEIKWAHADGIYSDTLINNATKLTMKGNYALLDLLTPTF